jgi:integrase
MKINIISIKNRVGNIRLLLSYHCKSRKLFATGVVIPSSDFQPGTFEKPVRKTNPKADQYNRQISLLYHELQQIISTLRREDKVPSAEMVFQLHNRKRTVEIAPKNKRSFTSIFEQFLNEKAFSAATKKLYQNLHDQLVEWSSSICLEDFDLQHWTEFRNFLKHTKKHSTNTICIRLNKLKAMIKYLKSTGHKIPLANFPLPQEEIKKVFLDLKDLRMDEIKDLFLFQCYTALRVSDLRRLNKIHIKSFEGINFISMAAYKTNKPIMIPLNEVAWNILTKYEFVLPSITEQHYNREIKKLLRLSGITTTFEWQTYDDTFILRLG